MPVRLTRHFALISGVALAVAAALLSVLFAFIATNELVASAERNNIAVTGLFQGALLRTAPRFANGLIAELGSPGGLEAMRAQVVALMSGSPVVKVKIYDARGLTAFSTEPGQIGEDKSDDEGVVSALAGKVASELTYRDTYSSFESTVEHADLLSSYIPLRLGAPGGKTNGVFEIYSDVSGNVALITRAQILLTSGVVVVFALVYGGLVWVVSRSDSTIHRQHEQAVALALDALGRMTAGLAHDFNNLLGVVVGHLDLLAEKLPEGDQEAATRVRTATDAVLRCAQIVHSLLTVARRQAMAVQPCDMNQLVSEMLPLLRTSVGPAVSIRCDPASGRLIARMDAGGFGNVVLNLVINARDAMKNRSMGEVTLRTRRRLVQAGENPRLAAGDYALLEVADTGQGMSPEVVKRAFEPFFTTKGRNEGTGLGLAMVRGYAEQLQGAADIESKPGVGTTVRMYLPLDPGDEPEAATEGG
jgi:signal transduction histidine kinase